PTSRTTLICVAVMTGDEDSLNPLAYASSPKTVVLAAAIPASIISDNPLVVIIVPGCHTRRIAKTTAVNGSATPEMMSALNLPRFGGHPRSHGSAVGVCHGQTQAAGI